MRKRVLFLLLAVVMLGAIGYFYIYNIFLPIKLKEFTQTKARDYLHREITVGSIDFHPLKGFTVSNIEIHKTDNTKGIFLSIEKASFNILILPIFKSRNIIISSLKFTRPLINITRLTDGSWNFSDLIAPSSLKPDLQNEYNILLRETSVSQGFLRIADMSGATPLHTVLDNVNIELTISLDREISFKVDTILPKEKTIIMTQGTYTIPTRVLKSSLTLSNLDLVKFYPAFIKNPIPSFASGILQSARISILSADKTLTITGDMTLNTIDLLLADDHHIKGSFNLTKSTLTLKKNLIEYKGMIQSPAIDFQIGADKHFKGPLVSTIAKARFSNDNLLIQGSIVADTTEFSWSQNHQRHELKGRTRATNLTLKKNKDSLSLDANINIDSAQLTMANQQLTGDVEFPEFHLLCQTQQCKIDSPLKINHAALSLNDNLSFHGDIHSEKTHLAINDRNIDFETLAKVTNAKMTLPDNLNIQGQPSISLSAAYRPGPVNTTSPESLPPPLTYSGWIEFTAAAADELPVINTVQSLKGKINFRNNLLQTENLTFNAQESSATLSGSLTTNDKKNPLIDASLSTKQLDLEKITPYLQNIKPLANANLKLSGPADIKVQYQGTMNNPSRAQISALAQLNAVKLTADIIPAEITGINGQLTYSKDQLTWKDLQGTYNNQSFTLNGELNSFILPVIQTTLKTKNLSLDAEVNLLRELVKFKKLSGQYHNSTFTAKGIVNIPKDKPLTIDIEQTFLLQLSDLPDVRQDFSMEKITDKSLRTFNTRGELTGQLQFHGNPLDWKQAEMFIQATSPLVTINEYPFENFALDYQQRDAIANPIKLSSLLYGGTLIANASLNLSDKELPLQARVDLNNLDLKSFQKDKKTKNKELEGRLSLGLNLNGPVMQTQKLVGNGSLTVANGLLGQIKFIKGILSQLIIIPEFKDIYITDITADFTIANERISTKNAKLKSKSVILSAVGWIDFSKNLYFDINPEFSNIAIIKSNSAKKGATSLIKHAITIKCNGNLNLPQCGAEKSPLKILESTTDIIKEGVIEVLKDIF